MSNLFSALKAVCFRRTAATVENITKDVYIFDFFMIMIYFFVNCC